MADGPLVAKVGSIVKQDPELRYSPAGKAFCKFSLQVKPYAPKGETQPEAVYYEVTAFGSLGEHVAESLRKGHRVAVIGIGKLDTWTGKDGAERTTKEILADAVGPDLRFVTAELHEAEKGAKPEPQYSEAEAPF